MSILKSGSAWRVSAAPRKNVASRIRQYEHLHHIARESISALRHRTRVAAPLPPACGATRSKRRANWRACAPPPLGQSPRAAFATAGGATVRDASAVVRLVHLVAPLSRSDTADASGCTMYRTAAAAAVAAVAVAAGLTTTTMGQSSSNTGHSADVAMTMGYLGTSSSGGIFLKEVTENIRNVGLENSVLLAFSFHPLAPGFEGLQDAPAPPSRSHLSRRIIAWSPGMGCRWYCHMADTGAGLRRPASKTAIAHPHKSTTDLTRVSLPSNYLIDVTRAVSRTMSFFYATSISTEVLYISEATTTFEGVKHACTDSKRHNSLSREQTVGTAAIVHVAQADVAECGLTDVLESPPDHEEMPTWLGNKLKRGMYPRRRGRIVVGFLFTCTRCLLQQELGRVQLVLGSNDANGTNFPDGFEVNQWKDFKVSSATGFASIASGLSNSVDASKL
ncbi:hypothetical protein G5I_09239 [Acromyrmex echinatior]|uniref:Uncharacterized protein n=1 Tax=Acromyrmex echinatior TaxID=103372 RepID=F4WTN3_ACREC|nr:hypothetical protein G5I_09239 [Acromyrmex echinatior]